METEQLLQYLKEQVERLLKKEAQSQSESLNELAAAFAKARCEYPSIRPNKQLRSGSWTFDYADLHAILSPLHPILGKFGLSFYQFQEEVDGVTWVYSRLLHSSGQWIQSQSRLLATKTDQDYGKTLSYTRRYQAMLLLGIAVDKDPDDDDGEYEMDQAVLQAAKGKTTTIPPKGKTIVPEQYEELMLELDGFPELTKKIQDYYGIRTLADLPSDKYHAVRNKILQIKADEMAAKK